MKSFKQFLKEAKGQPPLSLEDAYKKYEKEASKYVEKEYIKEGYGITVRKAYIRTIYYACMRALRPQGFDISGLKMSGYDTGSVDNAYSVGLNDKFAPRKWIQFVKKDLTDMIKKNEKKWLDSRYEFIEKDGRKYIRTFW